ncbi:hypothetical protein Tco_0482588 [Tanacetum coccineum]
MKIQDLLEKRIEKAGQHLNKEKQIMHINKEKEKMVMERVRPCREDKCPNRREYQRFNLWPFGGKRCEKNYSSVRRYVADPDNAYPKRSITKLILKGAVIFDVVSYQFRCALNYSKLLLKLLNQEYAARIRGKLIQKLLLNQKCMGYLVRAYYSISPTKYYKDDSCWSADLKSNTTEDVISI